MNTLRLTADSWMVCAHTKGVFASYMRISPVQCAKINKLGLPKTAYRDSLKGTLH